MTRALTGSMLGGIIGAAVAQQEGAMVGSVAGSILGQILPGPADVLSDLLGDLGADGVKQTAAYLWSRVKTTEKQAIHDHLQLAWQDAFREAIYDIGGKACFPDAWRKRTRKLDEITEYHIEYPYSLLRDHHQRPNLAGKICTCLQQLAQMTKTSPTYSASDPTLYLATLPGLEDVAERFMETAVLPHVRGEWLIELSAIGEDHLFDLEAHLRRVLFPRLLAHLGENLQRQPEVWRAFNRLMWQCLQLELDQLARGQIVIQEQLAVWQQKGNVETLSEQMAQVLSAVGPAQRNQGERMDELIARLVVERQYLSDQISDEHRQTRAEVRQMVEQAVQVIVSRLPAGNGLDEATLQNITRRYQELLADQLRYHRFQGIAQFQKAIRLPLADFYLELGLLWWKGETVEEKRQLVMADQAVRQRMFEHRLEERVTGGLGNAHKLIILGEPGAGKTMTLHFAALMLALGQGTIRLGLPQPYLPVLVRLADYARTGLIEQSLSSFLCQYVAQNYDFDIRLPDVLRRALDRGLCLVMIDGLDEIGTEPIAGQLLRSKVLERVQQFADQWCNEKHPNRLIVTSRKEGYRPEDLADFKHVELSPLRSPDEIEIFLRRWYVVYERVHDEQISLEQAEERAETAVNNILPQILRSDSVRYLATNPLMLTILLLVYENVGQLPDRRVKLYEICAQTLIQSWRQIQTRKAPQLLAQMSANQIFAVIARLAYWLHEYRPGGTATYAEWEVQLAGALRMQGVKENVEGLTTEFLHYARHEAGLLAERGLGQIGFFHLTFEEYLAGYAIAHAEDFGEQQKMIQKHWEDPRWREVLLLAVGEAAVCAKTPPVTNNLIWTLLNLEVTDKASQGREIVLAGRALLDVGTDNLPTKTAQDIQRKLRETMQNRDPATGELRYSLEVHPPIRAEAGEVLDRLGWLPNDLYDWVLCKGCAYDGRDLWATKYPVTNVQFAMFIDAGGYDNPDYWGGESGAGWKWRQGGFRSSTSKGIHEPEYWRDPLFGKERWGYPVVGISWYEASAYAIWLTNMLRQLRNNKTVISVAWQKLVIGLYTVADVSIIRLPRVGEWEKMAGGARGERYPWDRQGESVTNKYDEVRGRANVYETEIWRTSPVAMYTQGTSEPYRLCDLAGNIWEWAETWHMGRRGQAVRGGSWYADSLYARVSSCRYHLRPSFSNHNFGFRLVSATGPVS